MPTEDTLDNTTNMTEIPDETTVYVGNEPQPKPANTAHTTDAKVYTEAQYKGLQAVIAKRDMTIAKQASQNTELETKLAEAQASHGSAVTEKSSLDAKLSEANKQVTDLEKAVTDLQKKTKYQEIVLKEFPDLAGAAHFLPETDSEEDFRTNATELRQTLSQYVNTKVNNVLSGSSIPIETSQPDSTLGVDEVDKWYNESIKLAGIAGKEQEYEEAYNKYLMALDARSVD